MHEDHSAVGYDRRRERIAAVFLLACGLLLRFYFLHWHAFLAGDSYLYQDIAQNWLHAHIYGLSTDTVPRPTLIRLPGYPSILAALAWLFDRFLHADPGTLRSFLPVLWLQLFADLATCWIVASIVRKIGGAKAGLTALALACLCPFTANYIAVPLTETFTLFFLALVFYALQQWIAEQSMRWLLLLSFGLAWSVMLRPDQGLLGAAVLPALFFSQPRTGPMRSKLTPALICIVLAALPFIPWTIRNARTFHVFQPLAPKLANDPGEVPPIHFQRWFRTWAIDFTATEDAYWNYPEDPVHMGDLPERAFDSPSQRTRTAALLQKAAYEGKLDPQVEQGFAELARERITSHPVRYYLFLPAARLVNMLLHPRDEMLPIAERWWQYRSHPKQTIFAWLYAALNLAYLLAAIAGFRRTVQKERLLALSMAGYIVLRCLLLLTLDNAEQRYTLEFFPLLIVFASGLWARRPSGCIGISAKPEVRIEQL